MFHSTKLNKISARNSWNTEFNFPTFVSLALATRPVDDIFKREIKQNHPFLLRDFNKISFFFFLFYLFFFLFFSFFKSIQPIRCLTRCNVPVVKSRDTLYALYRKTLLSVFISRKLRGNNVRYNAHRANYCIYRNARARALARSHTGARMRDLDFIYLGCSVKRQ